MPDKDFDNLFKDKFMDAEIEPSADLWGNIAEQLEPKRRHKFPVLWVAAASVVVAVSVLLFTQNGEKVYLQGAAEEVAVASVPEVQNVPVATTNEETIVSSAVLPEHSITTTRRLLKREISKVSKPIEIDQKNIIANVQPSEKNEHLVIKRAEAKPLDVAPVVGTIVQDQTVYASANTTDYFEHIEESGDSKKSIRNVGDLINYVVDRVDKRDKKLIKFDTDDDDNSSIIGLNIGFLKLNKKK